MANIIPNENTWLGFLAGGAAEWGVVDLSAPTAAEIGEAVDLTDFLISMTASTTGNTVPTPRLKSRFETSIAGTATGQLSADFYRDDTNDLAWDTLPRGTKGVFLLSRFGGTGPDNQPAAGDVVEVWPVEVTSRGGGNLASNTAQMFTATGAVPVEPDEDAVVAA